MKIKLLMPETSSNQIEIRNDTHLRLSKQKKWALRHIERHTDTRTRNTPKATMKTN